LVATAFGEAQYVPTVNADPVVQTIAQTTTYMAKVLTDDEFEAVRNDCKCRHSQCSLWASQGECTKNPKYMSVMCAPTCQTCEQISYEYRCRPFDPDAPTALTNPGDLDRLFERILADNGHHTPTVLSRPPDGPWILQLDTFTTADECERLIAHGQRLGYGASLTVGKDGTVEALPVGTVRTSTNAWCEGDCEKDPLVQPLLQRIEQMLLIPQNNSEFLQLLNYEEHQFYRKHHDYLDYHKDRPQVRRRCCWWQN
jgi:prolyl 4-hydroxylase